MNHYLIYIVSELLLFNLLFFGMEAYPDQLNQSSDHTGAVKQIEVYQAEYVKQNGQWIEGPRYLFSRLIFTQKDVLKEETGYVGEESIRNRMVRTVDAAGNILDEHIYNAKGTLIRKRTYTYDDHNCLVESIDFRHTPNPYLVKRITYNERGQIHEKTLIQKGKLLRTTRFNYDEDGKLLNCIDYNPEGKMELKEWYNYDSKGNQIGVFIGNDGENTVAYWIKEYDDHHHLIKIEGYTIKRGLEMRRIYAYNEHGDMIDMTSCGKEGVFLNL